MKATCHNKTQCNEPAWRWVWHRFIPWKWQRFLVALVLIAAAAALRIYPLQMLGSRLAWLTFYPAVMLVAVYGGIAAGLLATLLACLTVVFLWPALVEHPFIKDGADWIGLGVFALTGTMISCVAEAMLRANARAQKAQAEAEAANRAKSVFLASMSHELRTPLNAILGFSGLLREEPGISPEQRHTLELINRSGDHLLSLINDVLDVAKIEAGRVETEIVSFDLDDLVRGVTDLMRVRAEEKNLQLMLDQHPGLPRFIRGDATKLRQVLINLVGNAIKFTEHGSVTLVLRQSETSQPLRLIFEVQDTGIGIAAEDQASIFEPFVQLRAQTVQKGTGLGLTITRRYVELMGGQISVESHLNQGSLFRVELPVQLAEQAEVSASIHRGRVVGIAPGQSEFRIMIVEDQAENRLLLRRVLEGVGFSVRVAENGLLGIEMFQSWRPHFIWMDIGMPVMDGFEATRRIRDMEGGQAVKIAAITASAFKEDRDKVMAAGMDDFLIKPFLAENVFDCLERHLGVRLARESVSADNSTSSTESLRPEMLANLPSALRAELRDALVLLDSPRIDEIIRQISKLDPTLGRDLDHRALNLNYTAILQALLPYPDTFTKQIS